MPAQRIKGQETTIIIVRDSTLETELTEIQNFTCEFQMEQLVQGYLGDKTNRTDDIYNGVKGDMELHIHSNDWFTFVKALVDRAKRLTPDVVFSISSVLNFPNGQVQTIIIADAKFGPVPHNIPARNEYVKVRLDFVADDFSLQAA